MHMWRQPIVSCYKTKCARCKAGMVGWSLGGTCPMVKVTISGSFMIASVRLSMVVVTSLRLVSSAVVQTVGRGFTLKIRSGDCWLLELRLEYNTIHPAKHSLWALEGLGNSVPQTCNLRPNRPRFSNHVFACHQFTFFLLMTCISTQATANLSPKNIPVWKCLLKLTFQDMSKQITMSAMNLITTTGIVSTMTITKTNSPTV